MSYDDFKFLFWNFMNFFAELGWDRELATRPAHWLHRGHAVIVVCVLRPDLFLPPLHRPGAMPHVSVSSISRPNFLWSTVHWYDKYLRKSGWYPSIEESRIKITCSLYLSTKRRSSSVWRLASWIFFSLRRTSLESSNFCLKRFYKKKKILLFINKRFTNVIRNLYTYSSRSSSTVCNFADSSSIWALSFRLRSSPSSRAIST